LGGVCGVVFAAMVRWVLGLCRTQGRRSFLLRKESVVGLVHLFSSSSSRHGFTSSSSEAAAAVGAPPRALQHHGPGKLVGKTALITGQLSNIHLSKPTFSSSPAFSASFFNHLVFFFKLLAKFRKRNQKNGSSFSTTGAVDFFAISRRHEEESIRQCKVSKAQDSVDDACMHAS
jgi:hypothetical protein